MAIELELQTDRHMMQVLSGLGEDAIRKASIAAGRRAALAARTAGTKQVHSIYTIKSPDLKAKTKITTTEDGATLRFSGSTEKVEKYKAVKRKSGVFVTIKRGGTRKIARGFTIGSRFVAREGRERLPVKSLYGPAVPQLYGNPEVMDIMQERGGQVLSERLEHEIERRLGV